MYARSTVVGLAVYVVIVEATVMSKSKPWPLLLTPVPTFLKRTLPPGSVLWKGTKVAELAVVCGAFVVGEPSRSAHWAAFGFVAAAKSISTTVSPHRPTLAGGGDGEGGGGDGERGGGEGDPDGSEGGNGGDDGGAEGGDGMNVTESS